MHVKEREREKRGLPGEKKNERETLGGRLEWPWLRQRCAAATWSVVDAANSRRAGIEERAKHTREPFLERIILHRVVVVVLVFFLFFFYYYYFFIVVVV